MFFIDASYEIIFWCRKAETSSLIHHLYDFFFLSSYFNLWIHLTFFRYYLKQHYECLLVISSMFKLEFINKINGYIRHKIFFYNMWEMEITILIRELRNIIWIPRVGFSSEFDMNLRSHDAIHGFTDCTSVAEEDGGERPPPSREYSPQNTVVGRDSTWVLIESATTWRMAFRCTQVCVRVAVVSFLFPVSWSKSFVSMWAVQLIHRCFRLRGDVPLGEWRDDSASSDSPLPASHGKKLLSPAIPWSVSLLCSALLNLFLGWSCRCPSASSANHRYAYIFFLFLYKIFTF